MVLSWHLPRYGSPCGCTSARHRRRAVCVRAFCLRSDPNYSSGAWTAARQADGGCTLHTYLNHHDVLAFEHHPGYGYRIVIEHRRATGGPIKIVFPDGSRQHYHGETIPGARNTAYVRDGRNLFAPLQYSHFAIVQASGLGWPVDIFGFIAASDAFLECSERWGG